MKNFLQAKDYIRKSTLERRSIDSSNLYTWGLDFLDYHFGGGIPPKSLSLLACESGKGKTSLVSNIAYTNSLQGKKVALLRLEGDVLEFPDTEKWKLLYPKILNKFGKGLIMGKGSIPLSTIDYQSYRLNKIENIEDIEDEVCQELEKTLNNVFLFDKSLGVNKDNISDLLLQVKDQVGLIIIDHVHYFEMLNSSSQYLEQLEIVKTINDIVDHYKIPIVIVSHVRKQDNTKEKRLLTMEDIHGSSELYKISHNVIFMSPDYNNYNNIEQKYGTLIYSPKARYGAPTTQIGIKTYDGKRKIYDDGFELADYKLDEDGKWNIVLRNKNKFIPNEQHKSYAENNF